MGKSWKIIKCELESKPIYADDDKYIKAKIKSYQDKVNKNFQGKKTPKENSASKCLSIKYIKKIILEYFWMSVWR